MSLKINLTAKTDIKTRYDSSSDCLNVKEVDSKIKQSVEVGDVTFDFDSKGKLVGLQILNASEVMWFSEEVEEPAEFLKTAEGELETNYKEAGITVKLKLFNEGSKPIAVMSNSAPQIQA